MQYTENNGFLSIEFDYVITECDGTRGTCPRFSGKVDHRLHIGFDDPASASGTEAEILDEFRRIRDEIGKRFSGTRSDSTYFLLSKVSSGNPNTVFYLFRFFQMASEIEPLKIPN